MTTTGAHIHFGPRIWLAGRRFISASAAVLKAGFGDCRGNQQPAAALAEIAPLPGRHDILRIGRDS